MVPSACGCCFFSRCSCSFSSKLPFSALWGQEDGLFVGGAGSGKGLHVDQRPESNVGKQWQGRHLGQRHVGRWMVDPTFHSMSMAPQLKLYEYDGSWKWYCQRFEIDFSCVNVYDYCWFSVVHFSASMIFVSGCKWTHAFRPWIFFCMFSNWPLEIVRPQTILAEESIVARHFHPLWHWVSWNLRWWTYEKSLINRVHSLQSECFNGLHLIGIPRFSKTFSGFQFSRTFPRKLFAAWPVECQVLDECYGSFVASPVVAQV